MWKDLEVDDPVFSRSSQCFVVLTLKLNCSMGTVALHRIEYNSTTSTLAKCKTFSWDNLLEDPYEQMSPKSSEHLVWGSVYIKPMKWVKTSKRSCQCFCVRWPTSAIVTTFCTLGKVCRSKSCTSSETTTSCRQYALQNRSSNSCQHKSWLSYFFLRKSRFWLPY